MTIMDDDAAILAYADGTLPADRRGDVEADPAALAAVAEYRRLGELLAAPPVDLDWDRLAGHLSAAVAAEDRPAVVGRIGFGARAWGAIAAAAALAVGVGLLSHRSPVAVRPTPTAPPPSVAVVTGPTADVAADPAVADVRVGPSPALTARDAHWRYAEGVVTRRQTVVIAGR